MTDMYYLAYAASVPTELINWLVRQMRIEVDRDGKLVPSFEDLGEPPVLDGYEIVRFQTVLSGDGLKVVWTQKPRAGEQPWDLATGPTPAGAGAS